MHHQARGLSRNRDYKSVGKLRAQHRRDLLAGAFKCLSENVSRIAAFRTHMACDATVLGWIAKRIASVELQELRHCER